MKSYATILLLNTIIITLLAAGNCVAQTRPTEPFPDELLLLVDARTLPNEGSGNIPLHIYQRMGEEVIAGIRRIDLSSLDHRGVSYRIIDDEPWTEGYAVVGAPFSVVPLADADVVHNRSIASAGDVDIIKGSRLEFDALRAAGYSCVEILRKEIPLTGNREYLPDAYTATKSPEIDSIIGQVSNASVTSLIQGLQDFGTRYWNNANRDAIASWVRLQFFNAGIKSIVIDSFTYSSTWQKNVIATIPGTVNPDIELIVGGHMDSYSSNLLQAPGADDNASGTAAVIEMARVLKAANYQPAYTLRFIAFGTEEAGLVGSASYASRARTANRDIRVMLNFDMIANRNQAQTDRDFYMVWYTGAEAFRDLQSAIARQYTTLNPVPTTSYRSGSDSYSFWQQSYKSTFCIERDFSPYYHTPNDLIQYLDIPYAADIIKAGLATLLTLDMAPPCVANPILQEKLDGTSLRVQWDSIAVPDFSSYKIYWGTEPGVYTNNATQTTREKVITGLTTGVRYYVGISIIDMIGREGMITEISGIPRNAPLAPLGLTAYPGDHAVRLGWNHHAEPDVVGFNLYRSEDAGGPYTKINVAVCPDTSWIDSLFTAGIRHYYIRAVDASANESSPSDTVAAAPVVQGVTIGVSLQVRWNIISNPVITVYDSVRQLFSSSVYPHGYSYTDPAGYQQAFRMVNGRGYWTKSATATTAEIFGDALLVDSIPVGGGWNLIGSISVPVAVASLTSNPPGLVTSEFIAFNGGYSATDSLLPGKGYWVRFSDSGTLILGSTAGMSPVSERIRIVPTSELPPPPPADPSSSDRAGSFRLNQAYPNPFNPTTVIGYSLLVKSYVTLKVFDILGREVATLVDEVKSPGTYSVKWDASEMPAGVYYCRLQGPGGEATGKLMLVK